ncbi:MAG: cytochrome c biogenesis protein CcsA [Bdellovibrionales bacterium]|nr:cytochrome c biogenesis protein CcsA [Bdellovibrionales bacterium]
MKTLRLTLLFLVFTFPLCAADAFHWGPLETIAIQDRGRLKPFDTFAEESVLYITGKRSWEGEPSEATLFGWMASYEDTWSSKEFILVDYKPLKAAIGIAEDQKYFAPEVLIGNQKLGALVRDAFKKQKPELTELDKKAQEVSNRVGLLQAVVSGDIWTIFPNPTNINEAWYSIASLTGQSERLLPYESTKVQKLSDGLRTLIKAYIDKDAATWNKTLPEYASFLEEGLTTNYPTQAKLKQEVQYNKFRPFRWAWVLYTVGFLTLLAFIFTANRVFGFVGAGALGLGFAIHTYGFALRMLISGRPPVTNMYESVIWVSWGCMLFAAMIWLKYKNAVIPTAAAVFSLVALVLADNLPSILDPSINPLEPVLRSNFWLTIHVLTITLSYAAFALSLCLGNVVLGNYGLTPNRTDRIQQFSLYMYRSMQIGVVLLAAGTILGGVWADYSWGRFWGWDPKEVWALIALLLYVAVLHGRFTNWLRGFGFAAVTVVSFLGVLMAWYGVNFVLGAGLHSYGFGSGGIAYVLVYVSAQVAFILFAYSRHRSSGDTNAAIFPKGHR